MAKQPYRFASRTSGDDREILVFRESSRSYRWIGVVAFLSCVQSVITSEFSKRMRRRLTLGAADAYRRR